MFSAALVILLLGQTLAMPELYARGNRERRQTEPGCAGIQFCAQNFNASISSTTDSTLICDFQYDYINCLRGVVYNCTSFGDAAIDAIQQRTDVYCGLNASTGCAEAVQCAMSMVKYTGATTFDYSAMCYDMQDFYFCLKSKSVSCTVLESSGMLGQEETSTASICSYAGVSFNANPTGSNQTTTAEPCSATEVTKCNMHLENLAVPDTGNLVESCGGLALYMECLYGLPASCNVASAVASLETSYGSLCNDVGVATTQAPYQTCSSDQLQQCVAQMDPSSSDICSTLELYIKCMEGLSCNATTYIQTAMTAYSSSCPHLGVSTAPQTCSNDQVLQCTAQVDPSSSDVCSTIEQYIDCLKGLPVSCNAATSIQAAMTAYSTACPHLGGTNPTSANGSNTGTMNKALLLSMLENAKMEAMETVNSAKESLSAIQDVKDIVNEN